VTTAMPLVLIFGVITTLLVRSRDMRAWEATMAGLFGFYLAMTPVGWFVVAVVNWLLGGFLHH
jgi:hypothetical protein